MDDKLPKSSPSPAPAGYSPSGERKETIVSGSEKVPIVETTPPREIEPSVQDYVKKIETGEEIQLPQPVRDEGGEPLVTSSALQQVTITLPLTEEEMKKALHLRILFSLRWLGEWTKRLAKIVGRTFAYTFKN